jgi:hypothetical protein
MPHRVPEDAGASGSAAFEVGLHMSLQLPLEGLPLARCHLLPRC